MSTMVWSVLNRLPTHAMPQIDPQTPTTHTVGSIVGMRTSS